VIKNSGASLSRAGISIFRDALIWQTVEERSFSALWMPQNGWGAFQQPDREMMAA